MKPQGGSRAIASSAPPGPLVNRKPTAYPTPIITRITTTLRARSAAVRPASTAARESGIDVDRSTMPLDMSSDSPTPVWMDANGIVWTKMPVSR